jgi:hypothetical protein
MLFSSLLPRLRGRIQEGASHTLGVGQFQIGLISYAERSPLLPSPSCILPRVTGEEKKREEKKEAQRLP